MAIGANSYGTVAEVASLAFRYTNSGSFDTTTNPTAARVEAIIDRVSGVVNAYLAQLGFTIPVSQADAKLMLDNIVVETTAVIVEGIRGSGRFAPNSKAIAQRGMWQVLTNEIMDYLAAVAVGLEELGAARSKSTISRIGYRSQDEGGDDTFPLFQRDGFGNVFTDWDT